MKEGEACAWERRVSACSTSPGYHPVTLPPPHARPRVDLCASGAKKGLRRDGGHMQTSMSRRSGTPSPRCSPLAQAPSPPAPPQGAGVPRAPTCQLSRRTSLSPGRLGDATLSGAGSPSLSPGRAHTFALFFLRFLARSGLFLRCWHALRTGLSKTRAGGVRFAFCLRYFLSVIRRQA